MSGVRSNHQRVIAVSQLSRALLSAIVSLLSFLPTPSKSQALTALQVPLEVPPFDPEKDEVLGSVPLVGYRHIPEYVLDDLGEGQSGIPVSLFVASAKSNDALVTAIRIAGKDPESATWQDWYNAACSLPPSTVSKIRAEFPQPAPIMFDGQHWAPVDANLISLLPTTELFECSKPRTFYSINNWEGTSMPRMVEMLEATSTYSDLLRSSYANLSYTAAAQPGEFQSGLNYARFRFGSAPKLSSVATFHVGDVTFGKPLIHNSKKAGLEVPEGIAKEYDVYAVYVAASIRNLDMDDFDNFTIGASPQAESIVLDLIPLHYDKSAASTSGTGVVLKSLYQRQVVLHLKPTVRAAGLQERDFSWSLSGDAMHLGAVRFVVILGVPRGAAQLPVNFFAQAKYRETWLSQGGLISTPPKNAILKFK